MSTRNIEHPNSCVEEGILRRVPRAWGVLGRAFKLVGLAVVAFGLSGCHVDMWRQPKLLPQHESTFFPDGSASRPPVAHTIAQGQLREDETFYRGIKDGELVTVPPLPVTAENLKRGQKKFEIHCAPCHGPLGYGNGMIAQRGLALRRTPGNYHTDRLRGMPIGYFYDVITNGAGVMYSLAAQVSPEDRWRIAMYVRVLQLSQHASLEQLPADQRKLLGEAGAAPAGEEGGRP